MSFVFDTTLYVVGETVESAICNELWDNLDLAYKVYDKHPGYKIWAIQAFVDTQTIELIDE